jgi:hypothetical protein
MHHKAPMQLLIAARLDFGFRIVALFFFRIRRLLAILHSMHRIEVRLDRWIGLHKLEQRWGRILNEAGKFTGVSRSLMNFLRIISVIIGSTFVGSSNVHLIALESTNLLEDPSENPGPRSDTSSLQKETDAKEDVGKRVGQEGDREGRRHKLPCNGRDDRCDDGAE